MIVPDAKPDILNTINASGNICIYKKEIFEDRVKVEGCVMTNIMYLPDSKDDNLRALNCNIDFSENIQIQGVKEGMTVNLDSMIKDIECKVLNGRKISIRAGIEFNIKIYSNEDVEIINTINNIEDIQTLPEEFSINSLIGNGKTTVYAKDTLGLNEKDEIAEILKTDLKLQNQDIKISYNKVLTKAELLVNILYLTEDNRIENINSLIPIVGFIDIQNISEENNCETNYELKNMIIKPNSQEEHSIYVEFEIEVSLGAYEKRKIHLIQDLYSPSMNLGFSQKRMILQNSRKEKIDKFTLDETTKVAGLANGNLLDVETNFNLSNTVITNTRIKYIGEFILNFIFWESNNVRSSTSKIPFEFSVDNNTRNRQNKCR